MQSKFCFWKNSFQNFGIRFKILADKEEGGRGSEPYRLEAVKINENRLSMAPIYVKDIDGYQLFNFAFQNKYLMGGALPDYALLCNVFSWAPW